MDALTVSVSDATRILGVGRTHLYQLINSGKIESVQLGRRRLIKTASLRSLVEAPQ
jgi:excisionase family DNA binding protein